MLNRGTTNRGDASNNDLVAAAKANDQDAWVILVHRFQPLVDAITRRVRLAGPDAEDVSQVLWLRLATHLHDIRDPAALPGWIATTATRCALEALKSRHRVLAVDPFVFSCAEYSEGSASDLMATEPCVTEDNLLRHERQLAVRHGLARLSPQRRALLEMLAADPPISYEEIHRRLDLPIGSIGPTRARALKDLRQTPSVRALIETDGSVGVEPEMVA